MTDDRNTTAAYLSALRRNYTFDTAREALAEAAEQLTEARDTLTLIKRLQQQLGVMDHRLITRSITALEADLHTLQDAVAATFAAVDRLRQQPHRAGASQCSAADGVRVVPVATPPGVAPDRDASWRSVDYWPTEAGLAALAAMDHAAGPH